MFRKKNFHCVVLHKMLITNLKRFFSKIYLKTLNFLKFFLIYNIITEINASGMNFVISRDSHMNIIKKSSSCYGFDFFVRIILHFFIISHGIVVCVVFYLFNKQFKR
ncbi:hypothetical protein EDEG_03398 [Edhazardia aedis USNM 41457]|uniref:Uncharacterized protein n=1 Tax=Edhazardia aedis (strain USNM 41457) TaxID=1003232 RepID=J9D3N8_EDHAE|nr:hypothetical protein EDEG_03398 [Edhazardia aedis USNM 41457]|eukprot:EJW02154.1 hypothetical protein EDEG_03398 [Edhazardia aedis USNM 41457]